MIVTMNKHMIKLQAFVSINFVLYLGRAIDLLTNSQLCLFQGLPSA